MKYLESELAEKTNYKPIQNAYQRNDLSIVSYDGGWWIQTSTISFKQVYKEMKKHFPNLKYLYD